MAWALVAVAAGITGAVLGAMGAAAWVSARHAPRYDGLAAATRELSASVQAGNAITAELRDSVVSAMAETTARLGEKVGAATQAATTAAQVAEMAYTKLHAMGAQGRGRPS